MTGKHFTALAFPMLHPRLQHDAKREILLKVKQRGPGSPSSYLHKLRLADAPLRLARGEQIVNVSLDAGYNDLSRFYKQFRKTTKTSPGVCQTLMKPSAK